MMSRGEHELLRARETDPTREEVGAARIRDEADPGEHLAEARPIGGHHEVARQGEIAARAGGGPVDHRDRGRPEAGQGDDRAVDLPRLATGPPPPSSGCRASA